MAVFDPETQRIIVRVVYDGPAGAGKTTNLRQLCSMFTTRRRGELIVPEEWDGRTMYFDWLSLEGGLVGGYKVQCHLLTVAGQRVLAHRRSKILQRADVVVFVCDSSGASLARSRTGLRTLQSFLRTRTGATPPLVVQANKQDLPDAWSVERVTEALELDPTIPVIAARAAEGVGVRETVVLAIRAGANEAQRMLLEHGIDGFEKSSETADDLLRAMQASEESALPAGWIPSIQDDEAARARSSRPPPAHWTATELRAEASSMADGDAISLRRSDDAFVHAAREETFEVSAVPAVHTGPPLPTTDVPPGFIWPSGRGREQLRKVPMGSPIARHDLVSRHGMAEGSGSADLVLLQVDGWCLKTSPRRRYANADDAREALRRAARMKLALGTLRVENTVLVVQPDEHGNHWLWTVAPWLGTLRAEMARADGLGDERALGDALCAYAGACVVGLQLAARQGLVIDLHPSNLARTADGVVYLDDDVSTGSRLPLIGYALLHRVEEYGHRPAAVETYVSLLARALRAELSVDEIDRLDLDAAIRNLVLRNAAAEPARKRLLAALSERHDR